MKLSNLLLLVMLALVGCNIRSSTSPLQSKLKVVTVADGISESEAEIIADCYFSKHVGCGNFEGIRDGGNFWIVNGRFGLGAEPIVGFHIDKANGNIASPIGPNYASPFEISEKGR